MITPYEIWQRQPTEACLRNETDTAEWGPHRKVYKSSVSVDRNDPHEALEHLFKRFNIDHPEDFRGHSLSIGDVVVFPHMLVAFECARMGWDECDHPTDRRTFPHTTTRYLF